MATYSIELGKLIESGFEIGLDGYPSISEDYRNQLNNKIINTYWFHEIGFETPDRFRHELNNKMNNIMGYYVKLLETELLEVNPLISFKRSTNQDWTEERTIKQDTDSKTSNTINVTNTANSESDVSTANTQTLSGTTTQTDDVSSTSKTDTSTESTNLSTNEEEREKSIYETPGYSESENGKEIDNVTGKTDTEEEQSSTSQTTTSSENTSSNIQNQTITDTGTQNTEVTDTQNSNTVGTTEMETDLSSTDDRDRKIIILEEGHEIPLADLILKYRETFLKVDSMILDDLRNLFMLVF